MTVSDDEKSTNLSCLADFRFEKAHVSRDFEMPLGREFVVIRMQMIE